MSRFYGNLDGRGTVTKGGTEKTGISTHVRGWEVGVQVHGSVDEHGRDIFEVYVTRGSNNPTKIVHLVNVGLDEDGFVTIDPSELVRDHCKEG